MKKRLTFLFLFFICSIAAVSAQVTVTGVVVDKESKEPLIGVAVFSMEDNTKGAVTQLDGSFKLTLPEEGTPIKISYLGYLDLEVNAVPNLGTIEMETTSIGVRDVVITSSVAVQRKTPVAVSVIPAETIEAKIGPLEFPEILKSTPGIYATKQGGGYGDSRVNLRGFETENIAVMINGVPMNDMEWGGIYWSNWAGLTEVTRSMQVQRGLGASKVASPSIGGSINIVTKTTDAERGGSVSYLMGNDGRNKIAFNVSTGLSDNGWAMTLLGAKDWGDGYIKGTEFESYTWFANVSKIINPSHHLSLTAFGSPQWHNQRTRYDKMNLDQWQNIPDADGWEQYKFNPTLGYDENGQRVNGNRNRYHKPQISLNHHWDISYKSSLSTSFYVSLGNGGGRRWRGERANDLYGVDNATGQLKMQYRDPNTLVRDYSQVQQENRESQNGSKTVMSESINNHQWYGLLSTYNTTFGKYFDFYGGIDLRYYIGEHREKIRDLFGGEYYVDTQYRRNHREFTGEELNHWMYQTLKAGDDIYRNNKAHILQTGVFAQGEFNKDDLSVFVSGALSNHRYWKVDKYYYDGTKTPKKNFVTFNVKGGANYNIDKRHNVFFNTGYMTRAPYMRSYYERVDQSNNTNKGTVNEKSYSVELGYGYRSRIFTADVNFYHTAWMDKSMVRSFEDELFINMKGVDAIHRGIELEFTFQPIPNLDIKGMLSLGDWKWDSTSDAKLYDDLGNQLDNSARPIPEGANSDDYQARLDLKDVRVGNSPQTSVHGSVSYKFFKQKLTVGLDYTYHARNYADYQIDTPNIGGDPHVYYTPWRIPSAGAFDFFSNYRFKLGSLDAAFFVNVQNVFNSLYITDATDFQARNQSGAWDNIAAYYAFGRTYTVSLKINF